MRDVPAPYNAYVVSAGVEFACKYPRIRNICVARSRYKNVCEISCGVCRAPPGVKSEL